MNDSENQQYCGTHGDPLDNNRCCEKCRVKWDNRYELSQEKKGMNDEEYKKWKDNYVKEWGDGIFLGRKGNYVKDINDELPMNQKEFYRDRYFKENLDSMKHAYFCDNCEIVNWHHLTWCPKCGGKFSARTMKKSEFVEKYGSYKSGY